MEPRSLSRDYTLPTVVGALIFVLGIQSIRFMFASTAWYLRDTVGVATLNLVPIALAPFAAAALVPILSRFTGVRWMTWSAVLVLGAARSLNQVTEDPMLDHWTSAIATAAFVGLLPMLLSIGRPALAGGVLLGIALDTAIRGLGLSVDLGYQVGGGALVATLALAIGALYGINMVDLSQRQGVNWASGAVLIGLGPYLFAQFLVLQSQGWTAVAGAVGPVWALARIALLDVVALYLAYRFAGSRRVAAACAVVMGTALMAAEASATVFNVLSVAGAAAAGPVLVALIPSPRRRRVAASGFYLIVAALLFVLLGLAYYLPLDLALGFTQEQARLVAAGLVVVFGVVAALRVEPGEVPVERSVPILGAVAMVLPAVAVLIVVMSSSRAPVSDPPPIRVMSYNLHSAFNTSGQMDIEAIARVIEDSEADVVGLQEVERGRLINGGVDLLTVLQYRLGFEYVAFFGTSEPTWGNAILSRYPLGAVETAYLPKEGTLLRRGYLAAPVAAGGTEFLFISTHLQHINDPDVHEEDPEADLLPVHRAQIGVILDRWQGRAPAVMVGDLNARPGWTQIEELLAAGWLDAWEQAGRGPGYTANAADPRYRIDWILHTPDFVTGDAGVILSQASDHFAVVADIAPRP